MKFRFTFLLAFCFLALGVQAQVENLITGIDGPVGLALDGETLYVGAYNESKIYKADLSQPSPVAEDFISLSGTPSGLFLKDNYLYCTLDLLGRLVRVDITASTPTEEVVINSLPFLPTAIVIVGDILYGVRFAGGDVYKIDISQPNPVVETVITGLASPNGITFYQGELYVSEGNAGRVVKFDPLATMPVSETVVTGLFFPRGLNIDGGFLYISDAANAPSGKIARIELNNPNPTLETVVSGLSLPAFSIYNGLDLIIPEFGADKISKLTINTPAFSNLGTVCEGTMPSNLGGASPAGGVYSGPGVTDNGDGSTFSFDPVAAGGLGTYTVTYTFGAAMASADLEVVAAPNVTFTGPGTFNLDDGVQTGLGGGSPAGGVYSGTGVTDDGNGTTYSFDPAAAGEGTFTITYDYTNADGCSGSATGDVTVEQIIPGDVCDDAQDIQALFGQAVNEPQVSELWDNAGANATGDPSNGFECHFGSDPLQNTLWYTFEGDGNTYRMRSVQCTATDYIDFGDTQVAVYSGPDCSNLTPVACNEDEDFNNDILNFQVEFVAEEGVTYHVLVDGFDGADGEFCLEVTNITPSSVSSVDHLGIEVFPNPTSGLVQLKGVQPEVVRVMDNLGRLVLEQQNGQAEIDLAGLPSGLYTLLIGLADGTWGSAQVVKQ